MCRPTSFWRVETVLRWDFLYLSWQPGARQDRSVCVDSFYCVPECYLLFVVCRMKQSSCKQITTRKFWLYKDICSIRGFNYLYYEDTFITLERINFSFHNTQYNQVNSIQLLKENTRCVLFRYCDIT